ncbi:unnamed protein product [Rotaria sp. Silwood1]|nr:unnamed protein product [Rotaria sp. Silwood1]
MGGSVEIVAFEPLGHGASEPSDDWNTENVESELLLLRQVVEKSTLRKPFILFGASTGRLLAHLYRLTYLEDVTGIILFDPTPSNVFERQSPMVTDYNHACFLFGIMARVASWGLLRIFSLLSNYFTSGEVDDIFRRSHPGYKALFMAATMLQKLESQFRHLHCITNYMSKPQNDATIRRDTPLLVISALQWTKKRPHGGLTREEIRQ